jgi:hypothetical protein
MRAVEAAGDPTQCVELATNAGLEAWPIKRVYGVLPAGARGQESVITSNFSPSLGASLGDWTAPARRLLVTTHVTPPDAHELCLLLGEPASAGGPNGMFRGIALARGTEARRAAPQMPTSDLENLRRIATRRRNLQELLERTEGNVAWAGQVASLIDGMEARGGSELLFQLAAGYRSVGRLDLVGDSYYLLAKRYPESALADEALVWLVQFGLSRDDRLRRAAQLADYLKSGRPMLYSEPAVRFAEVAAQRQLGYANEAKRYFLTLGQRPSNDPWRRCGETEQWLAQPGEKPPPKVLATCRRTVERPHLDGQLDEPFWDAADQMRLRGEFEVGRTILSADGNNPTDKIVSPTESAEVRLAYDSLFLYVAVRCPKVVGADYRPDNSPRPRDAELAQHDRLTLRLDLDRDFTTAFALTVDHRGWTHEACWGDATWDPSWYVAAANDEASWTAEAAVPLAELTFKAPAARDVWAVAARRTMPRLGNESWAGVACSADSPDEFGMLIFE